MKWPLLIIVCFLIVFTVLSQPFTQNDIPFMANANTTAAAGTSFATQIVQSSSFELTRLDLWPASSEMFWQLPNGTQAGNAIQLIGQSADTSGWGLTVTDDGGNTWIQVTNKLDAGNSQRAFAFRTTNCAAGTRLVKLKNTNAVSLQWVSGCLQELCGVSDVDVVSVTNGSSTTLLGGTIIPTQSNDLIFHYTCKDSGTNFFYTNGVQSNIPWGWVFADCSDSQALQYGMYNATNGFSPTMTASTSHGYIGISVAWKTAQRGTPRPNDMRIVNHIHQGIDPSTFLTQQLIFPMTGNLHVFGWTSGDTNFCPTNIASVVSNNWQQAAGGENHCQQFEMSTWWFATNAIGGSNMTFTIKWRGRSNGHGNIQAYSIQNAAPIPYDTRQSVSGTQTVAGNLTSPGALTPSVAGGIYLAQGQWATNTATNVTGNASLLFDAAWYTGIPTNGPQNMDQNMGLSHMTAANTTPITNIWVYLAKSGINGPVATYVGDAIYFKPPP